MAHLNLKETKHHSSSSSKHNRLTEGNDVSPGHFARESLPGKRRLHCKKSPSQSDNVARDDNDDDGSFCSRTPTLDGKDKLSIPPSSLHEYLYVESGRIYIFT